MVRCLGALAAFPVWKPSFIFRQRQLTLSACPYFFPPSSPLVKSPIVLFFELLSVSTCQILAAVYSLVSYLKVHQSQHRDSAQLTIRNSD